MEINKQKYLQIIDKNDERLKHLCKVYSSNNAEEKDLYQEMIIQIWTSLSQFKGSSDMSTWIYRIALNVSISFVRKKKTRHKYQRAYKEENRGKSQIKHNSSDKDGLEIEQLYQAISQLNTSEKAIITMYLENFTYAEIAKVTQITENYVGVKLNRIKKKLTQIINKKQWNLMT